MTRYFWLSVCGLLSFGNIGAAADVDLDDLQERAIKAAVAKVAPCVVQIETSGGTDVISAGPRGAMIRKGIGPTSGVIVGADGYIISSAFNFANKPSAIIVAVPGQKERLVAKVVATDQTRMLTLLKVEAGGLPVPTPAPKGEAKIGHTAIAVGRTLAANIEQSPSVSVGIISALNRIWGKAMQTDAKVSPTNYGGPLVDLHGRLLGILVPASPRAEGETAGFEWYDSGIGFAIPFEDVLAALPRLRVGKDLKRGLMGVSMQNPDQYGATPTIGSVAAGSAAEKAGIKSGDIVQAIDGKPVNSYAQILHQMGTKYEGDVISVTVKRGMEVLELKGLVLGGVGTAVGRAFFGILPMRDDPTAGVEVRYVYPKSPAEAAGVKVGDRIQKIGRSLRPGQPPQMVPVANRDALLAIFDNAGANLEIKFEVKRKDGGKVETLSAMLGTTPDSVPDRLPVEATLKKAAGAKTEKVEVGLLRRKNTAGDRDYWVYVPENYDGNCSHAVVAWLHPPRKNRERDIDDFIFAWQGYCEDHRVILVGPSADNETGWTPGDSNLVNEAIRFVADTYTVDRRRVVAHGMGQGGQFAYYLGFNSRASIRGVATVGAALASNPKEPVNNQPLAFYLVSGGKDPLKDAIAESRTRLADQKYPVALREIPEMGHQYIDGGPGVAALDELIRWLDSLDRI